VPLHHGPRRFEAIVAPANSYALAPQRDVDGSSHLAWRTQENHRTVEYALEPARSDWERAKVKFLLLIHLDNEL
jgi:cardiolipin synthase C